MLKKVQTGNWIVEFISERSAANLFLLFILLLLPFAGFAQKYSFSHYDIEDGLTQSQVTQITQDKNHHLLVSTQLGIGRFDGKTFTSITKANGIPDNAISYTTADKKGRIWACSPNGLYYYYGEKINLHPAKGSDRFAGARILLTDNQDNIWGIKEHTLFKIADGNATEVHISGKTDTINRITKSENGTVYACVFNVGIFRFENNKWVEVLHTGVLKNKGFVKQIVVDKDDPDRLYVLTNDQVLSVKGNIAKPMDFASKIAPTINYLCQDNQHGLWIAAIQGAYHLDLNTNTLKYFNEDNGFTGNTVNYIFKDVDQNIWFGTNGAGLYRFNGNSFIAFNQTQQFSDPNIMQFTTDVDGKLLMASSGFGLMKYDGQKINKIDIRSNNPLTKKVFTLCRDNDQNLWIGTLLGGLWKKTGNNITPIYPKNKRDTALLFNDIKLDRQNKVWVGTNAGIYYINKNNSLTKLFDGSCRSLWVIGHDSVLVALVNSLVLIKDGKVDPSFKCDFLTGSTIVCINYYQGRVFIGTFEHGLLIWDPRTNELITLNNQNGLASNSVYSTGIDPHKILWVGTGKGISKFKIDPNGHFQMLTDENISGLIVECNQNSMTFFNDQVWIGTTRGLLVLNDKFSDQPTNPYTLIQGVRFFNKQPANYTYDNGYKIPYGLKLPHDNSHITLNFKGINYKNPNSVSYSYQLTPIESRFSPQSKNDFVDYPSLPPGSYVFYVRSYGAGGAQSNTASFTFEVTPAYYQTVWFKAAIVLLVLLAIFLILRYRQRKDELKRRMIEKLRVEEQVKIRKQTAEDFHDDLGNKLTRINMLSDILNKRIDASHTEEKKLIGQIKENADALFTGSKHILWALDPDNDQLSEVLNHVSEFGIDIFSNTPVSFSPEVTVGEFNQVTLPMGHGRNIILIFKELFNNILKHAEAKNVTLSVDLTSDKDICISVEDDGKGFDAEQPKSGNGMRNIRNRAKKVNGLIEIKSAEGNGTGVALVLNTYRHLF